MTAYRELHEHFEAIGNLQRRTLLLRSQRIGRPDVLRKGILRGGDARQQGHRQDGKGSGVHGSEDIRFRISAI